MTLLKSALQKRESRGHQRSPKVTNYAVILCIIALKNVSLYR